MNSIVIGADIAPRKSNEELFIRGDIEELIGKELIDILRSAKYRIFNLECPLASEEKPIKKEGPNLIAKPASINAFKAMEINMVTLANNHVLDQNIQGISETRKVLEEVGIGYVGVGASSEETARPYIFKIDDNTFGVYACAEHEFSIVSDSHPGANPFDALESFDHVSKLKAECDFVIVLYHGGKEHYRYPSPNLQKVCHKFLEKGADLVICQQSHCIGCAEVFKHGTIVYGQGNFLFDFEDNEFSQSGLLVCISTDLKISYIPVMKRQNAVRLAEGEEATRIMDGFRARSEEIKMPGVIEKRYKEFAKEQLLVYAGKLLWHESFLFKAINKILGRNRLRKYKLKKMSEGQLTAVRNYIECEAHRDLILCGLCASIGEDTQ